MRRIASILAAGAAISLLCAAPAGAVTIVVHMYGPGRIKDVHTGGVLDCTTPEGQPSTGVTDCSGEYGVFSGPEIQASVPSGWGGGQRFVGFDQPHSGEIDCDDAPLASGICTFGTGLIAGAMYVNARFTDTTAPLVTVTGSPTGRVASTSATFTMTKNDPVSTFECNRDSLGWAACGSGIVYSGLSQGGHSLSLRARDPSGNSSAIASRSWTVDTVAPVTTLDGPSGVTGSGLASFAFSASEAATFLCSLDSAVFTPCAGSRAYSGLADGSHTFRVVANDGLQDGPVASRTWTVDTAAPDTVLDSAPGALTRESSSAFAFHASEAGATFECRLAGDGGHDWQACTSPRTYAGLPEGPHTFSVRATDAAQHVDPSPAEASFLVDRTSPNARIVGGPPSGLAVTSTSVTFGLISDDSAATYSCSFDAGPWTACSSPVSLNGLTAGDHELDARATDAAGNTDPAPARRLFRVVLSPAAPAPAPAPAPIVLPAPVEKLTVTLSFFAHATARSTRFTRIGVTGVPAGATTTATCSGTGCPKKRTFTSTRAGTVPLTPFKTTLPAGTKLTVRVTKPGAIGAVKVLTVRKRKSPLVATQCLPPASTHPTAC